MTCDTVKSICDDTLQQFSISEHVGIRLFITCPPSSVRAACRQENVCPDIDLCVCAHSGCLSSPSLPLNEESCRTLIHTRITLHFPSAIRSDREEPNWNWFAGLTTSLFERFPQTFAAVERLHPRCLLRPYHFSKLQWWKCVTAIPELFQTSQQHKQIGLYIS